MSSLAMTWVGDDTCSLYAVLYRWFKLMVVQAPRGLHYEHRIMYNVSVAMIKELSLSLTKKFCRIFMHLNPIPCYKKIYDIWTVLLIWNNLLSLFIAYIKRWWNLVDITCVYASMHICHIWEGLCAMRVDVQHEVIAGFLSQQRTRSPVIHSHIIL